MTNYKKITISNESFKQGILFPIDELGLENFNNYMVEINKLATLMKGNIKVKDVSYKKVPKGFVKSNIPWRTDCKN